MNKKGKIIRKKYSQKGNGKRKGKGKRNRKTRKIQRGSGLKTHDINNVKIMYFSKGKNNNNDEKPGNFVIVNEKQDEIADINIDSSGNIKGTTNHKILPKSVFSNINTDIESVETFLEDIVQGYNGDVKKYPKIVENIIFKSNEPYNKIKESLTSK